MLRMIKKNMVSRDYGRQEVSRTMREAFKMDRAEALKRVESRKDDNRINLFAKVVHQPENA